MFLFLSVSASDAGNSGMCSSISVPSPFVS